MKPAAKNQVEQSQPTLYDESHYKPRTSLGTILAISLVVLLLLLAGRFLDHLLWWNMTKLELNHSKTARTSSDSFLGLAGDKEAREKLDELTKTRLDEKLVVTYFDFVYPTVFLVNNRGARDFFNLGRVNLYLDPGINKVYFYGADIVKVERQDRPAQTVYYGNSLFPAASRKLANILTGSSNEKGVTGEQGGVSYIMNYLEGTKYLRIPYTVYFFLPLLVIIILGANLRKFHSCFFYFVILSLLSDFREVCFTVPFSWVLQPLGLKPSLTISTAAAAVILICFLTAAVLGLFAKPRARSYQAPLFLTAWGKGIIAFFLLLPFVLRF